jgi:nucleotide sugar dehydrogenase
MENGRILIIGLGEIGYSNAEYMTSHGLKVDGYDISERAVQRALSEGVIRNRVTDFSGYDCYIICISTHDPNNMARPRLDGIFDVAHRLSREGKAGALFSIESTITQGTSARVIEILRHRMHVAHVPHRYYGEEKEEHGVQQLRVLGGCEQCCTNYAKRFYEGMLDIPVSVTNSVEIAELSKIVENAHRFVEIAFAEELKMVCDRCNIDFEDLRNAVNTKWNVEILEAREGIGGHCLPKDSQMLLEISGSALNTGSIIERAKTIDQFYRRSIRRQTETTQSMAPQVRTG